MSEGIWIAIIGLIGAFIAGFFALRSLKATLKNNLDLAMLQLNKGQTEILDQQVTTHKLVNSRMTELLKETRKASNAEGQVTGKAAGKAEEKASPTEPTRKTRKKAPIKRK